MKCGDVVWLKSACKMSESDFKSGNRPIICVCPKMTVEYVIEDEVTCVWWNGNNYLRDKFNINTLIVIEN